MIQTINIEPVTAPTVRMRVTSVKQGSMAKKSPEFDCVCISEAKFEK